MYFIYLTRFNYYHKENDCIRKKNNNIILFIKDSPRNFDPNVEEYLLPASLDPEPTDGNDTPMAQGRYRMIKD